MAESELAVLTNQCLSRRIPDKQILEKEVAAWLSHRNKHHAKAGATMYVGGWLRGLGLEFLAARQGAPSDSERRSLGECHVGAGRWSMSRR